MTRRLALTLFVGMSIPFGIAGHLASEFASLGTADRIAFSPVHLYLAALALAVLVVFALAGRRVTQMTNALPWHGRGAKFFALSAALQLGFVAVTQIAEGCPVDGGDVLAGIVTAILASLAGAFFFNAVRKRIVRIVVALYDYLDRQTRAPKICIHARRPGRFIPPVFASFCTAIANRPPPISSL